MEVEPLVVEELQIYEVRLERRPSGVYAAAFAPASCQEPDYRHRRDPVIVDVHPCREDAGHYSPVYHARGLVRVPARRDEGAFFERRAVGGPELCGELRGQLDIGKTCHSVGGEDMARPLLTPYQARRERRVVVYDLVGPYLDVRLYCGVPADRAVVAHDHAFGKVRPFGYERVPADDVFLHKCAAADGYAVPENRVDYDGPFFDGCVRAYDGIDYPGVGFYPAVGPYDYRAFELCGEIYP